MQIHLLLVSLAALAVTSPAPPAPAITSGNIGLRFDVGSRQLTHITVKGNTTNYTLDVAAAGTTVRGCAVQHAVLYSSEETVCVNKTLTCHAGGSVHVSDCFAAASNGVANTVEWTSAVHSESGMLWSAPIYHGLSLMEEADTEQGSTGLTEQGLWAAWDSAPGTVGASLLAPTTHAAVGNAGWWLGGLLEPNTDYTFLGPRISVPTVCTLSSKAADDVGLQLTLDWDDFLSTKTSLNATYSNASHEHHQYGLGFEHHWHRLGNGSRPATFRTFISAIPADPRAALGNAVALLPTYFQPTLPAVREKVSGTGWYTHCGPAVGGCDLQKTNASFAAALEEIGFAWVWNNNFAEAYMGNFVPPVSRVDETWSSDKGYTVSVDLLKRRYTNFKARGVEQLLYFSVMEFGGGPGKPTYAMKCLPSPSSTTKGEGGGEGGDGGGNGGGRGGAESKDERRGKPVNVSSAHTRADAIIDSWRDPNTYLAARALQHAVVRRMPNVSECAYSAGWPGERREERRGA